MDNLVLLTVYFLDALGMKNGKMVSQGFLCLFVPNRDAILFVPAQIYHFASYIRHKAACHLIISAFQNPDFICLLSVFLSESQFLKLEETEKWGHFKKNDLSQI